MNVIVLRFDDTPSIRKALLDLAAIAREDEASFFADEGVDAVPDPEMARSFEHVADTIEERLIPPV